MVDEINYAFFTHRVESFKGRKITLTSVKGKKTSKTFYWPHPDNWGPTPRSLAAAGFFFNPEVSSIDRVECFCCKRGLGSWEKGDDPFQEHYNRAENECAWAAARCSLERDRKGKGKTLNWKFTSDDRLPTHPSRYEARLSTFQNWAFDGVKGATCTSKALALAGFIHTPEEDNEDLTTCFYCDRELSGWSAKDDPLDDHKRGEGEPCIFVTAFEEAQNKKKPRRPTRTVSKAAPRSSLATSRSMSNTYASEADVPAKRATVAQSRKAQSEIEQDASTDPGTDNTHASQKPRRAPGRPKKTAARESTRATTPEEYDRHPPPTAKKAKRTSTAPKARSGKTTKVKAPVSDDEDEEEGRYVEPTPKRPVRAPTGKVKTSKRAASVASSSSSEDALLLGSEDNRRSQSRASSSRASSHAPRASRAAPSAKTKRTTRASSRAPSAAEDEDDSESDNNGGASEAESSKGGKTRGSTRGRKTVTARDAQPTTSSSARKQPAKTPGRQTHSRSVSRSIADVDEDADVEGLLRAASARAAARLASASETEGARPVPVPSLGRSTRGRPAPSVVSISDDGSDHPFRAPPTVTKPDSKSSHVSKAKATTSRKPSSKQARAAADEDTDYLAASVSEASDAGMNEVTPQPPKTSSSNNGLPSSSSANSIPAPNFSLSASVAPSERRDINGWRQMAVQGSSSTGSLAGDNLGEAGEAQALPRVIAPLRKSKGRVSNTRVKIEEEDEVMIISPPPHTASKASSEAQVAKPISRKEIETAETHPQPASQRISDSTTESSSSIASIRSYEQLPTLPTSQNPNPISTAHSQSLTSATTATALNSNALDTLSTLTPFIVSSTMTSSSVTSGLTDTQLDSTLEEFIRAETQRKYEETKAEGERVIRELVEEGERSRRVIVDHLRLGASER